MLRKFADSNKTKRAGSQKAMLLLLLFLLTPNSSAKVTDANLPRIEGYTKGELEIKAVGFGLDNPIAVGRVTADGIIHFDWPDLTPAQIDASQFFATSLKRFTRARSCKDPKASLTNAETKLVVNNYIQLFKYGQPVGFITPSTQKGQTHNSGQLGSTIDWIYSFSDASAKANCSKTVSTSGDRSFIDSKVYDIELKKGWNLVSKTLTATEDWVTEEGRKVSLPKSKVVRSIAEIPADIHWHLKYTANDELLEIEQRLFTQTPVAKQRYESWLPKKLGNLERTSYEIGKKLERIETTNNANLIFTSGAKVVDVTIVDSAGNKSAVSMFTLMQDMASRDWKEDTETGYRSSEEIDGTRVMTDYNEKAKKATLSYNSNDRFLVKAESKNVKPEELWGYLKTLNLEALIAE